MDVSDDRLKNSEARLRAFTEAIPLPMLTIRVDGVISRANAAAHEALGLPPGALPNRSVEEFAVAGDPGQENLCRGLHLHGASQRIEMRARRADGELLWVLGSARLFTVQGETRYVLVFQDVTDLKRKEQALTEANEEAERNIRARMRFLAAASHDLRQPLQAMALFASALDHHVGTAQGRTIVQSLKTSLRGMEEMFDALLDMSKLDAGVMKAEPQLFMLNDIFEQLEMTYATQAEAAGLELRVVPTSVAVQSDPRLLARIIGNFLSNAIRYTRTGRVLLGVRRRGGTARVAVYDTGPGISESQRLEIFREFTQGATPTLAGRGAGMGLGLSIVQRLSRLLGHSLDVRSTVGKGSVFAIDVPMEKDHLPDWDEDDYQDEVMGDVAGATVVVVDDDLDIQDGLKLLLEEWGCRAIIASTAEEALAELNPVHFVPDLILADLHLRDNVSGIDAIRLIRERTNTSASAFLFTGDTEAQVADDENLQIMRKPLDPVKLRSLLAEALER